MMAKHNEKGGVHMITVKISGFKVALDYLKEVAKIGSYFRLKKFSALNHEKKNELFCEAMKKKFVRVCNVANAFAGCSFSSSKDSVNVTCNIQVKAEGELKKKDKKVTKTLQLKLDLLKLVEPCIESGTLAFKLEMNPGDFSKMALLQMVETNQLNDMKSFRLDISAKEMDKVKMFTDPFFWQQTLPKMFCSKQDASLLEDFIDILNIRKLTDVRPAVAGYMKTIYKSAVRDFPFFKNLSILKQVEILEEGYKICYTRRADKRDIHSFAKATYEHMAKLELHKKVIIDGKTNNYVKEYKGGRNMLYEYKVKSGDTLRNYVAPFDLWNMLTSTKAAE
jgi:hypothetical protein